MSVTVLTETWEVVTRKERYDSCCPYKLTNSTVSSVHHEVVIITSACKYITILFFYFKGMNNYIGILKQMKKRTLLHLDVSLLSCSGGGGGRVVCVYVSSYHTHAISGCLFYSCTDPLLQNPSYLDVTFFDDPQEKVHLPVEVMLTLIMGLKSLSHLVLFHLEPLSVLKYNLALPPRMCL